LKGYVSAIVLAAGESSRMGRPKLLLPFFGRTIVECTVENVLGSLVSEVMVVTGSEASRISSLFDSRPVRIVWNDDYAEGMVTSIIAGMRCASPDAEAVLVLPGDQPMISSATINLLLAAFEAGHRGMAIPVYRGRTGHPALFSLSYRDELINSPDRGARGLIYGHPEDVLRVEVDSPEVIADIDTASDYERLMRGAQ
jgi:molybdenum cofactor cytidylyltransferase